MDIRKFLVKFFQIIFWKLAVGAQARALNPYLSYRYKHSTTHLLFPAEVRPSRHRSDGRDFAPNAARVPVCDGPGTAGRISMRRPNV